VVDPRRPSSSCCSCGWGLAVETVIAGYQVGDGPANVVTPLMIYLAFVVLQVQRWRKSAGLGTGVG
jgi:aminobenzoyl-glutamate transport protein